MSPNGFCLQTILYSYFCNPGFQKGDLNTNQVLPVKQSQKNSMDQNDPQGIHIRNIPDLRLPRIKEYPSILKKQTKIFHQVPAQYPLESAEVAITVFYLSKIIFSNEC